MQILIQKEKIQLLQKLLTALWKIIPFQQLLLLQTLEMILTEQVILLHKPTGMPLEGWRGIMILLQRKLQMNGFAKHLQMIEALLTELKR